MTNKKKRKPMVIDEIKEETMPDRQPVEKKTIKAVMNPSEEKPIVPLRVFLTVCGMKWDQIAGFKYYAEKNKLGPFTVEHWRIEFENFWNKPINT
jgi:hypothetical protein